MGRRRSNAESSYKMNYVVRKGACGWDDEVPGKEQGARSKERVWPRIARRGLVGMESWRKEGKGNWEWRKGFLATDSTDLHGGGWWGWRVGERKGKGIGNGERDF
jgi:hypothetical protein